MAINEERVAEDAAERAVKKTFAILGIDINSPFEVEQFRRDLRFAGDLRKMAGKSMVAFIISFIGLITAAIWTNFKS